MRHSEFEANAFGFKSMRQADAIYCRSHGIARHSIYQPAVRPIFYIAAIVLPMIACAFRYL